ncbi:hypothetical protein NLU13_5802 [Sarocladium strictum]|uniref:Major facilitator superfamily (MFS) profile domain-containing protein n=1 Tax=Sarocladium strictum TaxID=5046 RepID=A0AA39GHL2_SARSR|nr:hypothetical protein NLU13_5802 [Sarocladium strictum]
MSDRQMPADPLVNLENGKRETAPGCQGAAGQTIDHSPLHSEEKAAPREIRGFMGLITRCRFLLGGSAVVLPFGKLFGSFNTKWLFNGSVLLFNVGSAICGAAPNMNALIVGRVLAGIGGNGMYLGVQNLLSISTTPKERPGYLSFVGVVWGLGTVLGPVIGGAFTESKATWRWAFYINLCISALFAPFYIWYLPSFDPRASETMTTRLREFDVAGSIISIGAITSLIMAMNFGGTVYAWNSGQIIALFVVAVVLFILLAIQQGVPVLTDTNNRVFPAHFLRNYNAVILYCVTSAVNAASFIPIYYIPIYFQFTRGDDAILAAVRLLPLIVCLTAMILASGHLISRYNYFQPWYIGGSVLALVGGVLFSRVDENSSTGMIYGLMIPVGLGTGAFTQTGYAVIQAMTPPSDLAYAISFIMLAQLGGIAFGLTISGSVFINTAIAGLSRILPDATHDELQRAISGTSGSYFKQLDDELRAQATSVIVGSIGKVYILVYVGAAFCLVLSACFTQRKMYKGAVNIVA